MSTALFFTPGWCLISYASNVVMLYIGRIFTGVAAGFSSLAVPVSFFHFYRKFRVGTPHEKLLYDFANVNTKLWENTSTKIFIPGPFSVHDKHHNRLYEGLQGFPLDKLLSYHNKKFLY